MKTLTCLRSVLFSLLLLAVFVPGLALAAPVNVKTEFDKALDAGGLGKSGDVEQSLGNIISVVLGFVGVAVFALVVYAGALWILAAGNEDKIEQSKRILKGAVLGLIIVFSAWVIVKFVLSNLDTAITGEAPPEAPAADADKVDER
ncbi:MAG: hypothetical protein HY461_01390 [Parcubacteria group bacterium]|nr:hypothetical protein [Parcubacteria group bacterium]